MGRHLAPLALAVATISLVLFVICAAINWWGRAVPKPVQCSEASPGVMREYELFSSFHRSARLLAAVAALVALALLAVRLCPPCLPPPSPRPHPRPLIHPLLPLSSGLGYL